MIEAAKKEKKRIELLKKQKLEELAQIAAQKQSDKAEYSRKVFDERKKALKLKETLKLKEKGGFTSNIKQSMNDQQSRSGFRAQQVYGPNV